MKIIKKGRKQKGWTGEFSCTGSANGNGGCGAILLVEQADSYKTQHQSYGDDCPDIFFTFTCGSCKVETDIKYTGPQDVIPTKSTWLRKGLD